MDSTIAILAGGKATRLYPKTLEIPKSMIEVAGKPFIGHQLELLKQKGIRNVVLCLGNLHKEIEDYVGNGDKFGLDVKYSFDGDKLVGTGGAIINAIDLLSDPFMIMYGDSFLNIDFIDIIEYFKGQSRSGLMTVLKNDDKWDKSNIEFKNGKIVRYEKNSGGMFSYIDFGLSMLKKNVLSGREKNSAFDLNDVFRSLIENDDLAGYEVRERFYEIGSFSGIEETEKYILSLNKKNNVQ
ncbi:MAG: NTP transferase domain-containing protein [Bacteroidetes bacterium]|nr:NTP transferase domain-containing protein [Bacteroidota bacterium]